MRAAFVVSAMLAFVLMRAVPASAQTTTSDATCFDDPSGDFSDTDSVGADPRGDLVNVCVQLKQDYLLVSGEMAQDLDGRTDRPPNVSLRLGLHDADHVDFVDCASEDRPDTQPPTVQNHGGFFTAWVYLPFCIGGPIPSQLWVGVDTAFQESSDTTDVTTDRLPNSTSLAGPVDLTPTTNPPPVFRLAGTDRIGTAIAISGDEYDDGQAGGVVLASGSTFPDALVSAPLAVSLDGPVLLTMGPSLRADVKDEIARVLPPGGPIAIVGGSAAVPQSVEQELIDAGYDVQRIAGADRFETAVKVADAIGPVDEVFEADGLNFPDALVAGAVAAANGAVLVLTAGDEMPAVTEDYLGDDFDLERFAVGGWAAQADPDAVGFAGADRYETALKVAALYPEPYPDGVGIASGTTFPDALTGGVHAALLGVPLILVDPAMGNQHPLQWIHDHFFTIQGAWLYGGTAALPDYVERSIAFDLQ